MTAEDNEYAPLWLGLADGVNQDSDVEEGSGDGDAGSAMRTHWTLEVCCVHLLAPTRGESCEVVRTFCQRCARVHDGRFQRYRPLDAAFGLRLRNLENT